MFVATFKAKVISARTLKRRKSELQYLCLIVISESWSMSCPVPVSDSGMAKSPARIRLEELLVERATELGGKFVFFEPFEEEHPDAWSGGIRVVAVVYVPRDKE